MQTFLPYADFKKTASVLDSKRLGKQRVETLQIAKALITGQGWIHHPATKMWDGYLPALWNYQITICNEWLRRGYQDSCFEKTKDLMKDYVQSIDWGYPPFIGVEEFHQSHRSNLMRKDPNHYGQYFDIPDDIPYWWPTKEM